MKIPGGKKRNMAPETVRSTEFFVSEVKKYPQLYNIRNSLYKDKSTRFNAWRAVSAAVNLSVIHCQKKWKNLRDRFVREKRKSEVPTSSGVTCPPTWHLYPYLTFLVPFVTTRGISNEEIEVPRREENWNPLMPDLQFIKEESSASFSISPAPSPSVQVEGPKMVESQNPILYPDCQLIKEESDASFSASSAPSPLIQEGPEMDESRNTFLYPECQLSKEESDVSFSTSPTPSPLIRAPLKKKKTEDVEQAILDMIANSKEPKDEYHHLMQYTCSILRTFDDEKRIRTSKKILDVIFEARVEK